jgi:hypothetical protein
MGREIDPYQAAHEHYMRQHGKKWPLSPGPKCWDEMSEDERMCWRAGFEEFARHQERENEQLRRALQQIAEAAMVEPQDEDEWKHVARKMQELARTALLVEEERRHERA